MDPQQMAGWRVSRLAALLELTEAQKTQAKSIFEKMLKEPLGISGNYDRQIAVYDEALGILSRTLNLAANGKAVHFEFNQAGTEVWVSDWAPDGAIVVLDAATLSEVRRLGGLHTPTGKFNVHNTAHDVY